MALGGKIVRGAHVARGRIVRDDRILPETRWLSAFIVPFLFVAFVMLYLFPGNTDTLFAWTIRPDMRITKIRLNSEYNRYSLRGEITVQPCPMN